jgi:hypothetical protein
MAGQVFQHTKSIQIHFFLAFRKFYGRLHPLTWDEALTKMKNNIVQNILAQLNDLTLLESLGDWSGVLQVVSVSILHPSA